MADGIDIKFNLPDFKRQLQALGIDMERKIVRSATNAAAQEFKKLAVKNAPILKATSKNRQAGTLQKAIYVARSRSKSTPGREAFSVSFRKGKRAAKKGVDAFYGRFLEAGWTPRGPGGKLRGGTRYKALIRARQSSGKIIKYRFLKPAFDAGKDAALRAFTVKIEQRIAEANRKR